MPGLLVWWSPRANVAGRSNEALPSFKDTAVVVGGYSCRNNNWTKVTAELPLEQFIERIIFTGFGGLLIDRHGYKDSEIVRAAEPMTFI
jgi:hypothetical protein